MRLRDLFNGDLTHRELIAYIRHLPQDGALGRELLGPAAEYDAALHRLTDIADLLSQGNFIAFRVAGGKGKQPKPIRRPQIPDDVA